MKIIKLTITLIIFLCSISTVSAQIQPRLKLSDGYLRSSIEKFSENEKRPLLKYLDDGRSVADQAMKLLAAAKYNEFYNSTAKSFKDSYSQEQFRQLIQMFENSAGKILFYEYRNQGLELPKGEPLSSDLSRATSDTHYALWITKAVDGKVFIDIETKIEDGKHKVSFITTEVYKEEIPPWLVEKNEKVKDEKESN